MMIKATVSILLNGFAKSLKNFAMAWPNSITIVNTEMSVSMPYFGRWPPFVQKLRRHGSLTEFLVTFDSDCFVTSLSTP